MQPADRSTAKLTPNRVGYVINLYLGSPKFLGYAAATQKLWRSQLRLAADEDKLGGLGLKEIRPSLVQAFLDGLVDRPAKQAAALAALRQFERWAIVRDRLPHPITTGCDAEGSDGGHIPWTDDHVALGEGHARPELARVITLAANTGQRGSDLVKMRWTDIEVFDGRQGINVTQQKTRTTTWVPFTQTLMTESAKWDRRPGYILLRPTGIPWTRDALTVAWSIERDGNPALAPLRNVAFDGESKNLVLHGLRGTACVRLLRAGANTRQISDMIGMSEKMVKRYTRFSEQKQNAMAAVLYLDRTSPACPVVTRRAEP